MPEYKKKNVKKLKAEKPKKRTVSDNYSVTSLGDNLFDEIEVKSSKTAREERKFQKQKAKYLSRETPNKRVVYAKKTARELNCNTPNIRVINGNKSKKARKRIFLAVTAFIIISAIILVQILSPTGIADLMRTSFATVGGSGYPVTAAGSNIEGLYNADNCLAVLSDGYFELYNNSGKELVSVQHTMAQPKVAVGYTRIALYDRGRSNIRIYDAGGEQFRRTVKGKIYNVALSKNGKYAVSYSNENSAHTVDVYDKGNNKEFTYSPKSGLVSAIAITANGKYTAVVCVNAKDGQYFSEVHILGTDGSLLNTLQFNELVYTATPYLSDGIVITFSNKAIAYTPQSAAQVNIIDSASIQLVANNRIYAFGAVMGANAGNENDMQIFNGDGDKMYNAKIVSGAQKVDFSNSYVAAAKDNYVYVYSLDGKLVKTVDCGVSAKKFALIDSTVYTVNNAKITATEIEKEQTE